MNADLIREWVSVLIEKEVYRWIDDMFTSRHYYYALVRKKALVAHFNPECPNLYPYNNARTKTLCYAMLCYAMLCYAMLCYDMLCYAVLTNSNAKCDATGYIQHENPKRRKTVRIIPIMQDPSTPPPPIP